MKSCLSNLKVRDLVEVSWKSYNIRRDEAGLLIPFSHNAFLVTVIDVTSTRHAPWVGSNDPMSRFVLYHTWWNAPNSDIARMYKYIYPLSTVSFNIKRIIKSK